jgi:hypothetical protein
MCTFLFHYCCYDLKVDDARDCQQLNLLPILPLRSGATGVMQVLTPQQAEAVSNVCSMGFSLSRSLWALSKCDFDVAQACEVITASAAEAVARGAETGPRGTEDDTENQDGIFVLAGDEVGSVFSGASDVLVDMTKIQPNELEFLKHKNMQALSNVRPFQAPLVVDLLRHILPAPCFAGDPVEVPLKLRKSRSQKADGDVSPEAASVTVPDNLRGFIAAFWRFSASKADVISAVAEAAAIVPILPPMTTMTTGDDGEDEDREPTIHLSPLSRMHGLLVGEKAELVLSQNIQSILRILGVRVVDSAAMGLSDSGLLAKTYWQYVQSPSRSGVIAAIDSTLRAAKSIRSADHLSVVQREELRVHMASCEPVRGLTGKSYVNGHLGDSCWSYEL